MMAHSEKPARRQAIVLRTCLLAGLLAGASVGPATPQSVFAFDAVGEWLEAYDLRSEALGRTVIGVIDPHNVANPNPAGAGFSESAIGHTDVALTVRSTTDGHETARRSVGTINGIGVCAPLGRGFGIRALVRPATENNFTFEQLVSGGSGDPANVRRIEGSRGLSSYEADLLYRSGQRFAIGAGLSIVAGSLLDETTYSFADSGWHDAVTRHEVRLDPAVGFAAGGLFRIREPLSAGLFVATAASGDATSRYRAPAGREWSYGHRIDLPLGIGAGLAYTIRERWRVSSDAIWRDWGSVSGGYRSTLQWGIGIERLPVGGSHAGSAWQRVALRAGYARVPWYLRDRDGDGVDEWRATAGIGLPIQRDRGFVNLTAIYGRRGEVAVNGLRETFLRFGLGFTFARVLREY